MALLDLRLATVAGSVALGFGAPFGITGQPVVDLREPVLEHATPLHGLRGAQVEITTVRRHRGRPLVEIELHERA